MKLIPAIDLKLGKCVRLSGGKEDTSIIFNDDPVSQAKFFEREGCDRIHIIDLDAAFGKNFNNKSVILEIRRAISIEIELGGGIRSNDDIEFWIRNGINYLIIGSTAIKQPQNIKKFASKFPEKLYVSLDDLNGKIMINGWIKESDFKTNQILSIFNDSNIRGFIFTDISRDGMMTGINIDKVNGYLKNSNKPIIISGGLSSYENLKEISKINDLLLEGVIAGKSFYLGKIKIEKAQKILNNNA